MYFVVQGELKMLFPAKLSPLWLVQGHFLIKKSHHWDSPLVTWQDDRVFVRYPPHSLSDSLRLVLSSWIKGAWLRLRSHTPFVTKKTRAKFFDLGLFYINNCFANKTQNVVSSNLHNRTALNRRLLITCEILCFKLITLINFKTIYKKTGFQFFIHILNLLSLFF